MSIQIQDIPSDDETAAVREAATVPARRRRWWRWPIRLAVTAVVLLTLLVCLLPRLLSTSPGTRFVVSQVNARIPGHIEVDRVRLAWLSGQELLGVRLLDPQGESVAFLGRVSLDDAGLFTLLTDPTAVGSVALSDGQLDLIQYDDQTTNLDAALGWRSAGAPSSSTGQTRPPRDDPPHRSEPERSSKAAILPADLSVQAVIERVQVSMRGPSFDAVHVTVPEATLSAKGPTALGFTLQAEVAQGADVGRVTMSGLADGLFDAQGRWSPSTAELDIDGMISRLPLTALDRLTRSGGVLEALIGPVLDAEVRLKGTTASLDGLIQVKSRQLNIEQAINANDQRLSASERSHATLQVSAEAWQAIVGAEGPTLVEPFEIDFQVRDFEAPRQGTAIDTANTTLLADLLLGDQPLIIKVPDRGLVRVESFKAAVTSPSIEDRFVFSLDSRVNAFGQAGPVQGEVEVRRGQTGWGQLEIDAALQTLSMAVLDGVLRQGHRLVSTFGDEIGVGVLAVADGDGGYRLTADFDRRGDASMPARLSGQMTGTYAADGTVSLKTDKGLRLSLTPDAFEQWMRPVAEATDVGESVGLSLKDDTTVTADVNLQVALIDGGGLRFDPERTRADVTMTLPETVLVDQWYRRDFPVSNAKITVEAHDLREPVVASLDFETGPGEPVGRFTADARVTGMMLDDGYIQLQRGTIDAEVEVDAVPTVVFDTLTRQKGYAVAAFGEKLSATIAVAGWSYGGGGEVTFQMQGQNGSVGSFTGVDRDGYFQPTKPMTFYLNQTPELANKIMRWVNPVLLPAVTSANVPFALTIDDDTFRLPTRDFDWSQFNADVEIQMGTVTISPYVSPVNKIVTPLQSVGLLDERLSYDAKVSPIALNIRGGVFSYDNLTFKIDDVALPFSGKISLVDQSIDLRMGMGGRVVEKNPWIVPLLGDGIKITGTVKEPQANFGVLQQLSDSPGQVIGGLLEQVFKREGKPKATPATTPDEGGEESEPGTQQPEAQPRKPEEILGGMLGDLLERELRKARDRQNERAKDGESDSSSPP